MKFTMTWLTALLIVSITTLHAGDKTEQDFAVKSPAQIREYELDVMRRIADLALIPPKLNTSPLPQYDYDRLDYGMTIGIERTPKGRLWACWVAGGDSPKAFFVLATSDDNGETWSKPRLVVDAHSKTLPMDRCVLVGSLWTDPLGRLWLIFDQSMDMFDGRAGVWASLCENPDADPPTWSAPRRIWHGVTSTNPSCCRPANGCCRSRSINARASAHSRDCSRNWMQELKVAVNDLRVVMPDADTREKLISADGVHFTPEGREKLARAVADSISRHLPKHP